MLVKQINDGSLTPGNWIKSILLVKQQTPTLLAATVDTATLDAQTQTDQTILNQNTSVMSVASCKTQTFSSGDLNKDLKKAVAGNEDVGRYV